MVKGIALPFGGGTPISFEGDIPFNVTGLVGGLNYTVYVEVGSVSPLVISEGVNLTSQRIGGVLSVENPDTNKSYYVVSRRPGTNTPYTVQTAHDFSETGFVVDDRLLGLEFVVRSPIVDPTSRLVTGYEDSQTFGPILHATDLPADNGTSVRWCATAAELNAAVNSSACTLAVLAPGTTWSGTDITLSNKNRLSSPIKITTPQNNPAVFVNSTVSVERSKGITLEGLHFYGARAWAISNSQSLVTGRFTENVALIGCRLYGDEVLEEDKKNMTGYFGNPTGSAYSPAGFNFMVKSFAMLNGTNLQINGCSAENVWSGGDFGPETKFERYRVRGVYWDNLRLNMQPGDSGQYTPSGGYVKDMIVSDYYGLGDEMVNDANNQAPHFDLIQLMGTGPFIEDLTFENIIGCVGDTRAAIDNATLGDSQAEYPMLRTSTNHRGTVYRNALGTARGPSGLEVNQSRDTQLDRICSLDFPRSGGGTSITTQGAGGTNEMRVTRSYIGTEIRDASVTSSSYNVREGNVLGLVGASAIEAVLSKAALPKNPIELMQYARPLVDDGTGPINAKGYMRPLTPVPARTTVSSSAPLSPGGFRVTLTPVVGATSYLARYRLVGSNTWIRIEQASNVFSITSFSPEVNVEFDWAYETADGVSRWNKESDRVTVLTATSPPVTAPTLTLVPEIGGAAIATSPVTATSTSFRNFSYMTTGQADTAAEYVSLFVFDQASGAARNGTPTPKALWIDQASAGTGIGLTEAGTGYSASPAASFECMNSHYGKPPADARGVRLNLGGSGSHTAVTGSTLFKLGRESTARQNGAATGATPTTLTVTLTVPTGTAFAVMAYSNNGAPLLSSPVETLGTATTPDAPANQWVVGRLYVPAGGTITITATNAMRLEVSAITG